MGRKIQAGPAEPVYVVNPGWATPSDLATHTADPSAHHDPVTLGAGTNPVVALAGQQLTVPLWMLNDYQRVVVVDAGGHGDYTSLAAALAAITDAAVDNRYLVCVFGNDYGGATAKDYVDITGVGSITPDIYLSTGGTISDDPPVVSNLTLSLFSGGANTYLKLQNCRVLSTTITHANVNVVMNGCTGGAIVVNSGGTIVLDATDSHFNSSVLSGLILRGTATLRQCTMYSEGSYTINLIVASTLILDRCTIQNTKASGYAVRLAVTGCTLKINGGLVEALAANGYGLYMTMTPTLLVCDHVTFAAVTAGRAVAASAAYANAPFMHCVFRGGQTNITCLAGVANGTSVEV
jgi:hypothetical protein